MEASRRNLAAGRDGDRLACAPHAGLWAELTSDCSGGIKLNEITCHYNAKL